MKTVKEVAREILDPIDGTYAVWDERVAAIIRADRESVLRRVLADAELVFALAQRRAPELADAHAGADLDQRRRLGGLVLAAAIEHVLDGGATGQHGHRRRKRTAL